VKALLITLIFTSSLPSLAGIRWRKFGFMTSVHRRNLPVYTSGVSFIRKMPRETLYFTYHEVGKDSFNTKKFLIQGQIAESKKIRIDPEFITGAAIPWSFQNQSLEKVLFAPFFFLMFEF
jgi:hypothetical protein